MGNWLPGATRDDKPNGGAWTRSPRVGVLHSTEGGGWPAYASGAGVAPHLTVDVAGKAVRQHVPFDSAARALRNEPGGVETNRAGAIQVELIGTCDLRLAERKGWVYLPSMDDGMVRFVAQVLARIHVETGVPLTSSVLWKDYNAGQAPSSYGRDNGVRLSAQDWRAYSGWLGHQHVPENDHGDPGNLPIGRMLEQAREIVATTTMSLPVVKPDAPIVVPQVPAVVQLGSRVPDVPRETRGPYRLGAFPLPLGHWFGPESRDSRVHSGYYSADAQSLAAALEALRARGWRGVPDVDRYTAQVEALVERYQADASLRRDGKLGRVTWVSIAQSTVR